MVLMCPSCQKFRIDAVDAEDGEIVTSCEYVEACCMSYGTRCFSDAIRYLHHHGVTVAGEDVFTFPDSAIDFTFRALI